MFDLLLNPLKKERLEDKFTLCSCGEWAKKYETNGLEYFFCKKCQTSLGKNETQKKTKNYSL